VSEARGDADTWRGRSGSSGSGHRQGKEPSSTPARASARRGRAPPSPLTLTRPPMGAGGPGTAPCTPVGSINSMDWPGVSASASEADESDCPAGDSPN
jgi:hypothetical protein